MLSKRVKRQLTEFVVALVVIALSTLFLFRVLESKHYDKEHSTTSVPPSNDIVLGSKDSASHPESENNGKDILDRTRQEGKKVEKEKFRIASVDKNKHPIKTSANTAMQEKIDYAWEVSKDASFIYTIEAENDKWDETTVGPTNDVGICQISKKYHPEVVGDKNFKDWKWQIRKCWDFYRGGVRFYGHDRIGEMVDRFEWID